MNEIFFLSLLCFIYRLHVRYFLGNILHLSFFLLLLILITFRHNYFFFILLLLKFFILYFIHWFGCYSFFLFTFRFLPFPFFLSLFYKNFLFSFFISGKHFILLLLFISFGFENLVNNFLFKVYTWHKNVDRSCLFLILKWPHLLQWHSYMHVNRLPFPFIKSGTYTHKHTHATIFFIQYKHNTVSRDKNGKKVKHLQGKSLSTTTTTFSWANTCNICVM